MYWLLLKVLKCACGISAWTRWLKFILQKVRKKTVFCFCHSSKIASHHCMCTCVIILQRKICLFCLELTSHNTFLTVLKSGHCSSARFCLMTWSDLVKFCIRSFMRLLPNFRCTNVWWRTVELHSESWTHSWTIPRHMKMKWPIAVTSATSTFPHCMNLEFTNTHTVFIPVRALNLDHGESAVFVYRLV